MNDIRDRIAEIIARYQAAYEAWDGTDGFSPMPRTIDYADQILSALTLPTVRMKCDKCGGKGKRATHRAPKGLVEIVCSCDNGYREYQRVWELPEGHYWNVPGTTTITNNNEPKPLSYLDLDDADVAGAYRELHIRIDRFLELSPEAEIDNNKGQLRLIEKEG